MRNIDASILKTFLNLQKKMETASESEMPMELSISICERISFLQSKILESGRMIKDVWDGSIILSVMCPTLEALDDLHELCISGELARLFTYAYVADEYRQSVTLNVIIDETEWQRCRAHLLSTGETQC